MFGGPITGASMNPARWLGPAIAAGDFTSIWVYLAAPIAGAAVAAIAYQVVVRRQGGLAVSHVLFVCIQNAGRSQMAHALFERAAGGRMRPARLGAGRRRTSTPRWLGVMRELGIDVAGRRAAQARR